MTALHRSIALSAFALLLAPSARADYLFRIGPGFYVWNGGMASSIGDGSWVGTGWDTFPGVSPPWDPVVPALPPVVVPPPRVAPPPPIRPHAYGVPVVPAVPVVPSVPAVPAVPRPAPPIVVIPTVPAPSPGPSPLQPPVVW
jgi:hypothetical protein